MLGRRDSVSTLTGFRHVTHGYGWQWGNNLEAAIAGSGMQLGRATPHVLSMTALELDRRDRVG